MTTELKNENSLTYNPYIIGKVYEGKGEYLGISKGAHKFKRHTKPFYQRQVNGPRYHFENLN